MENTSDLTVMYNGKVVGFMEHYDDNKIAFQYDKNWVKNGFSISPFSLPLTDEVKIASYDPFNGLFGVFYDSLPDGWGELLLNKKLRKHGINPSSINELTKLTLIDDFALGGLNYIPTNKELLIDDQSYSYDELYTLSKEVLEDKENVNIDLLYKNAGSSGGTRPKANILINNEAYIVKFPSKFDSVNISNEEYVANKLAKKCGIDVADFIMVKSNITDGFFASKRFDRVNGRRVHTISLSSLLETSYQIPNLDYVHLFQVIDRICVEKEKNKYEAFKRMCFNVFAFNKDDHGKNFSFIYDESINGYTLSKAYDLTILKDKFEHEMTVLGNPNPTKEDLINIAIKFDLSVDKCESIINQIENVCKNI